ncbi:Golgi apyrase [Leucoagaricus sp. SymC.cos]|nr:Golgi apyrase [Leucoagaricus sp. SymC.cos]
MAPPTSNDAWFAGRHFGIVVDAGSSGSRLQIYSWRDPKSMSLSKESSLIHTLPKVEKGTKDDESWVKKIEPGLSSLASDPTAVGTYLKPLISHAMEHIPPSLHSSTPIFLLATAGMRLLSPEDQAAVLSHACQFLRTHTNFKLDASSETLGPCGSSVRIITGEEEGLFGWIAVNYLMDGFQSKSKGKGKEKEVTYPRTTYGFLDMGGASTQIAFEPSAEHEKDVKGKGLVDVRLRLLSGEEIHHRVFVTTWLGYGTNQARERYVGQAIREFEETRPTDSKAAYADDIMDPCLPKGLELTESPLHPENSHADTHATKAHKLVGTGSFEECVRKTEPLLNKDTPCPDSPCLMNGIHVPPIDFSVSRFIGVSEYWYSSEHIFGLGGAYDFVQYERAAVEFCGRKWEGIMAQHDKSRKAHQLGGDGEVELDGKVVEVGVWGPQVEVPRLQMQCFKAAWIVNVIVDPGGNTTTAAEKVVAQAEQKGLGRSPTFQSVDSVGDIAISWTLGKMVLEASKEVSPSKKGTKPLVDPVDDIENYDDSPVKPIRPPFFSTSLDAIEDKLSPHLPSSLTRESLGFSPVLVLFWMIVFFVLFLIVYPFRRRFRSCLWSKRSKRDTYGELMEEGKFVNGNGLSSPTSSTSSWIRKIFGTTARSGGSHPLSNLRVFNPSRSTPTRSFFAPNGSPAGDTMGATVVSSTRYTIARVPSPAPGTIVDDGQQLLTSRSRNSSQVNLASVAQRTPPPISRASNGTLFSRK